MRIAVVGGGPGGLYFSILMRRVAPDCEITVFERNRARGCVRLRGGVLRRDADRVRARRPGVVSSRSPSASSTGPTSTSTTGACCTRSGGHGFSALGRRELLGILQRRALALGVDVRFSCEAPSLERARVGRSDRRRRRGLERGARGARRRLRPVAGSALLPLHVARHRPGVRRVQVLHRGDAVRGLSGARLPVQTRG